MPTKLGKAPSDGAKRSDLTRRRSNKTERQKTTSRSEATRATADQVGKSDQPIPGNSDHGVTQAAFVAQELIKDNAPMPLTVKGLENIKAALAGNKKFNYEHSCDQKYFNQLGITIDNELIEEADSIKKQISAHTETSQELKELNAKQQLGIGVNKEEKTRSLSDLRNILIEAKDIFRSNLDAFLDLSSGLKEKLRIIRGANKECVSAINNLEKEYIDEPSKVKNRTNRIFLQSPFVGLAYDLNNFLLNDRAKEQIQSGYEGIIDSLDNGMALIDYLKKSGEDLDNKSIRTLDKRNTSKIKGEEAKEIALALRKLTRLARKPAKFF